MKSLGRLLGILWNWPLDIILYCQQNSCKLRILNHVMGFKFLAHLLEDVALQLLWVFKELGNIQIIALFKENELLRGYSSISRLLQQCPFPIDLKKNLFNVIGPLRWVGSKKDFSTANNKIVSEGVPVRVRKGCGGQTKTYVNFQCILWLWLYTEERMIPERQNGFIKS